MWKVYVSKIISQKPSRVFSKEKVSKLKKLEKGSTNKNFEKVWKKSQSQVQKSMKKWV